MDAADIDVWISAHPLLFFAGLIWALLWKGAALWVAARANERWWFSVLLVVGTLGLLEGFYLFAVKRAWRLRKDA
ncbi:MAG: hypothetical protein HY475_01500 [Candidatus Terrybacteria bacterium]|nr:hypothetical protein [Candidatus Terrybacteria bacterium]